ncbi:MAG: flagellar basal body rod C-terminal domain-containing protein, partial [Phycisphaeraceae bacterium]
VMETATELTGAQYGALGIIGSHGTLVEFLHVGMPPEDVAAIGPPPRGEGVLGTIKHKHLETSNVSPVNELVSLIKTQRAFEMNSQTIQAADELLQTVGNLRRF